MPTRKTSVSLTDEAITAAQAAALDAGTSVSSWLSQAAVEHAWRERALAAAEQLHDKAIRVNGPLSEDDQRWVARILAATIGEGEPPTSSAA